MRQIFALALMFAFLISEASGQDLTMISGPSQQSGKYQVTLWLPTDGLCAGEEQQLEFRIVDTSRVDPVLGPAGVIRVSTQAIVTMPAMSSMPNIAETAHPEGPPGAYGLHPTFAHGGEYLLKLKITPPHGETFTVEFPLKVADDPPSRKPRSKPYKIEITTAPGKLTAGEPVRLQLKVSANRELRDAAGVPTGKRQLEQVKTFELMHEKPMHLIIVRNDLNFFAHLHPEKIEDGSFVLAQFIFPTPGVYQLFAEVAPLNAGAQVLLATLKVDGKSTGLVKSNPIASDETIVGGVKVSLTNSGTPPVLIAKKTTPLTVTLQNKTTGEPVTDLEPYLGAAGHLISVHEDAATFVHAHPDEREAAKLGRLTFLARWPKPGIYRVWIEFQRGGQVQTAEFVVVVKEAGQSRQVQPNEN